MAITRASSESAFDDLGDLDVHTQHVLHQQIYHYFFVLLEIFLDIVHVSLLLIAIS